jgi:fumarate hydratase, class II
MVAAEVMGNHVAATFAGAPGHLELNIRKPVITHNILQFCRLLTDTAESFARHTVDGLEPNREHIAENLAQSRTLVTTLDPRIGYDRAVKIGKLALAENITLKQAAGRLGYVRPEDFDRWVELAAITVLGTTLPGGGG